MRSHLAPSSSFRFDRFQPAIALALATLVTSSIAHAQWNVIHLNPIGATASVAYGIRNNQQCGAVDGNAAIWNTTAASFVSLGPGRAGHTDGVEQVGFRGNHAALWAGTAGSYVDLHPSVPGFIGSFATGVFAGFQTGVIYDGGFVQRGGFWSGTAASWVDLTPPGGLQSIVQGIYNGQEVGAVVFGGGVVHAGVWASTPTSFTDLNPVGSIHSEGYGVYNGRQVGFACFAALNLQRAALWNNTAASYVDLHPPVADTSIAAGVYQSAQAGYAALAGINHASFWENTAASWVDLHSFLPAYYSESAAYGVWTNNFGVHHVVGNAFNTLTNQYEALVWVRNAPNVVGFCFGDGSGTPCPCANNAAPGAGTGCVHSLGTGGKLVGTGNPSISDDTFALLGTQMPNGGALYFQGTAQDAGGLGIVFGDGLRCAGGTIIRLGVKINSLGGSQYPVGPDPSISVQGSVAAPGLRYYQIWYRDADLGYCTTATFNLTNGLTVPWGA
jgi:hypothetical protein